MLNASFTERYDEAIKACSTRKGKAELVKLDRWLHDELHASVTARMPKHLTKAELVKLVRLRCLKSPYSEHLRAAAAPAA